MKSQEEQLEFAARLKAYTMVLEGLHNDFMKTNDLRFLEMTEKVLKEMDEFKNNYTGASNGTTDLA